MFTSIPLEWHILVHGGALSTIGGGTMYFIAEDREWKSFYAMNAVWGITNMGIAYLGYRGAQREAKQQLTAEDALHRYEKNKRMFLLNAGLDVAYIATGVALDAYGDEFNDYELAHGFGKAIAVQGAGLLIFDGLMYAMHSKQDKKWYKLLQGMVITGNGVGYLYKF